MLTEHKRVKQLKRRLKYLAHRNRNPKDNSKYRAFKKYQDEIIGKMQKQSEERAKEDAKFGNKVKKLFNKFVPKVKPKLNSQRGK